MDQVILGRTGLKVSVVCLGAGGYSRLGQAQGKSAKESSAVVSAALDMGVTMVDTAPIYGTEAIVGDALHGRRDGVVLSTKVTVPRERGSATADNLIDGKDLARSVEESLGRLRTDRIDVLHLHGVTIAQYDYCSTALVPAMMRLREAGKIRFIGITERFGADTRHDMFRRAMRDGHWDVAMVGFNLLNPSALKTVLPAARQQGTGTMCMFAVRGGLANPAAARALIDPLVARGHIDAAAIDRANPLGFLTEPGVARSLPEAAYRYCRHAPGNDVVMTGTGSVEHLRENIASIHGAPLPATTLARLDQLFGKIDSLSGNPEGQAAA